jgi:hypothetical protein
MSQIKRYACGCCNEESLTICCAAWGQIAFEPLVNAIEKGCKEAIEMEIKINETD